MVFELTEQQATVRDRMADDYQSVRVGRGKNGSAVLAGGRWVDEETFEVAYVEVVDPGGRTTEGRAVA